MNRDTQPESGGKKIRVWDLPTRVFHWSVVVLVIVSWITAEIGGTTMQYHLWSGYAILSLVVFRLLWGIVGSETTRFAHFVRGPRAVVAYARAFFKSDYRPTLGHNPLGGWSVIVLLLTLTLQAGTGLFANDDILTEGPLYHLVSKESSDFLSTLHSITFDVFMVLVAIHVLAILLYRVWHRENLLKPLFTGDKTVSQAISAPKQSSVWLALPVALLAAETVYWAVTKL